MNFISFIIVVVVIDMVEVLFVMGMTVVVAVFVMTGVPARSSRGQTFGGGITKLGSCRFGQGRLPVDEALLSTRAPCSRPQTHGCFQLWNYGA